MSKILALAASFRDHSLNRQLLGLAAAFARQAGASVTELNYHQCDTPIYREEHVGETLPAGAAFFADALLQHDGLLLASPEYNWSIPGGLKNLIDWVSIDARAPLSGKTALLMCASPSARGGIMGLQQLRVPLEHLGMWVYPHSIGIGETEKKLAAGKLIHSKDESYMQSCISDFVRKTGAMSHAR